MEIHISMNPNVIKLKKKIGFENQGVEEVNNKTKKKDEKILEIRILFLLTINSNDMVPREGVEPPRPRALVPKTSVSTNFTTPAIK